MFAASLLGFGGMAIRNYPAWLALRENLAIHWNSVAKTEGTALQSRRDFLLYVDAEFLWHGIVILSSKQQPKHTLVLYAASTLFSILVMAPYKWDKKWMRIKTSIGMAVFGLSLLIYLFCFWAY